MSSVSSVGSPILNQFERATHDPSRSYSACSLGWHTNLRRLAPTVPGADKCIELPAVSLKLRIVPVAIGPE